MPGKGKKGKQRLKATVTFPPGITRRASTRIVNSTCGCIFAAYYNEYVHHCKDHRTCLSTHGRIRKEIASASAWS